MNPTHIISQVQLPGVITNDKDYKTAADAVSFLNNHIKKAEAERKELVAPFIEGKKLIDVKYKTLIAPLSDLVAEVKDMMIIYHQEAQKAQLALESKAIKANPNEHEIIVEDKIDALKHGEHSTSNVRTVTKYRVKDHEHRHFCDVRQGRVREYLGEGCKLPDWIETYEEEVVSIRNK